MIEKTMEKLGLRDEEITTFLALLEYGEIAAGDLAKKTGISRPSLYGFLKKLQSLGLAVESQKNGVKIFHASKREKIAAVLDERIAELEKGKLEIEKAFLEVQKGQVPRSPKFQLFEGKDGVKEILKDMLLYRNIETKAYWPIKAMIGALGEDFFKSLNRERIRRNIYTRAIWPEHQKVDIRKNPFLGVGEKFLREIRIAPREIDFEMGYWIYENKVAFISSKKESYGFIVESRELAEMLSSQFEMIWKTSNTITVPEKYTNGFLKGI